MKLIPINDEAPFDTIEIIKLLADKPGGPNQGISVAEMRRRGRLFDAVDKVNGDGGLLLEDADHAFLVQLVNAFQFGTANPKLLAVLDDIIEAKTPTANPAE